MTAPRVYLDTNVFIAAYENPGARSDHAWWLLDAAERGDITVVTSELTLAEVLVKPLAQQDSALAAAYQAVLSTSETLEVVAIDRAAMVAAAERRARKLSLRLPDALHLAAAAGAACAFFVTADKSLDDAADLRIVEFGPFSLDDIEAASPS